MSILRRIKFLNTEQLLSLLRLGLRYPSYILPTIKATQHCMRLCDTHFGKTHHTNTSANAFRHALWNILIIKYNVKRTLTKASLWAKRFTDWHEEFAPNTPLDKAMDLHNNGIGRKLVAQFPQESIARYVQKLQEKVTHSQKFTHIDELSDFSEDLVYLED